MTTTAKSAWTLLFCLLTAISAGAGTEERAPAEASGMIGAAPTVAFYEVEGCPICAKINVWLDELEAKHPGAATIVRQSVTTEGIGAEMKARGIEQHGVAIVDGEGAVLWAEQAHVLTQESLAEHFHRHAVEDRTVRNVEAACGRCIYSMEGAKGCPAAVMIEGKPILLGGVKFAAHKAGLCSAAKPARVAGHAEGDKFVATFIEVD